MTDFDALIAKLNSANERTFWFGPARAEVVEALQAQLGIRLPASFITFLCRSGGGGVEGAEISGIDASDPASEDRGTVLGDTKRCREEHGLPSHLAVIYAPLDEVCWCLDASQLEVDAECPVVAYDVFKRQVDRTIARDFSSFFAEYVALRS